MGRTAKVASNRQIRTRESGYCAKPAHRRGSSTHGSVSTRGSDENPLRGVATIGNCRRCPSAQSCLWGACVPIRSIEEGLPYPLGAHWDGKGTNFALFSANAAKVEICL